jgi:hypothetical protein
MPQPITSSTTNLSSTTPTPSHLPYLYLASAAITSPPTSAKYETSLPTHSVSTLHSITPPSPPHSCTGTTPPLRRPLHNPSQPPPSPHPSISHQPPPRHPYHHPIQPSSHQLHQPSARPPIQPHYLPLLSTWPNPPSHPSLLLRYNSTPHPYYYTPHHPLTS